MSTANNGQDPMLQVRELATTSGKADAARTLFKREDKKTARGLNGEGAELSGRLLNQVVFYGTKLALPAHLLELAKQTGGNNESEQRKQRGSSGASPRIQDRKRTHPELIS